MQGQELHAIIAMPPSYAKMSESWQSWDPSDCKPGRLMARWHFPKDLHDQLVCCLRLLSAFVSHPVTHSCSMSAQDLGPSMGVGNHKGTAGAKSHSTPGPPSHPTPAAQAGGPPMRAAPPKKVSSERSCVCVCDCLHLCLPTSVCT